MKTLFTCIVLFLAGGCAPYTAAQVQLAEQARRGLELCRQAGLERAQLVEQYHQAQRMRLDDAFDADVRSAEALTADWIIEHRRAYAAALDVLTRQRLASLEADRAAQGNFDAADEALQRLLLLQRIQLNLLQSVTGK